MRSLKWTAPALQDLEGIDARLRTEADADAAIRTLPAIRERADFLLDFPRVGPLVGDETRSLGVRGTNYNLIYRVLDEERIVIVRIFHASQD